MNIKKTLKWYLFFASIYLILDGLVHILDIKLIDSKDWPQSSFVYSKFIGNLYGCVAVLVGLLGIESSRNLEKYRNILYISAFWALGYGGFLVYTSFTNDFVQIFRQTPSLYFWISFYNFYLIFESALLFVLAALVYLFKKQNG